MEMTMSNQINYKQKYQELKMKFMESVDAAFRLGFEQGAVQAQQDQMMMQQQQQAEAQQNAIGQGNGAEGSPAGAEQQANPNGGQIGDMEPDSENPAGSELDQHIAKLESMLKAETPANPADLILLTEQIRGAKRKMSEQAATAREMKKSQAAIPGIVKALHKPAFKLGVQASHNMNSNAKAAVGMQEKIVSDIMKSWEDEEQKAASGVKKILSIENLTKKE